MVARSEGRSSNTYYTAALSPAVAGLPGIGLVLAWQHRSRPWSRIALCASALATAGYAPWLLPATGTRLPGWLRPAVIGLAASTVCCLAAASWRRRSAALAALAALLTAAAVLIVPAAASVAVVTSGLGPFEAPFEPARETAHITAFLAAGFDVQQPLAALEKGNAAEPYLIATQTAVLAAPFIWASGQEVVPIVGFTGTIPAPTLATLQHLIRTNFVRTFLQSPTTTDPRLIWVAPNCLHIAKGTPGPKAALPIAVYYCLG
jgi:hypothetical protein